MVQEQKDLYPKFQRNVTYKLLIDYRHLVKPGGWSNDIHTYPQLQVFSVDFRCETPAGHLS